MPGLTGILKIGVPIYTVLLTTMAWRAISRVQFFGVNIYTINIKIYLKSFNYLCFASFHFCDINCFSNVMNFLSHIIIISINLYTLILTHTKINYTLFIRNYGHGLNCAVALEAFVLSYPILCLDFIISIVHCRILRYMHMYITMYMCALIFIALEE